MLADGGSLQVLLPSGRVPLIHPVAQILADLPGIDSRHRALDRCPPRAKTDERPSDQSYHYEINLVLDDPSTPRRHILEQGNRQVTVHYAQELAEFLGAPLYAGTPPVRLQPVRPGLTPSLAWIIFNREVE